MHWEPASTYLQPGEIGNARIDQFDVSEERARLDNLRSALYGHYNHQVSPGITTRLFIDGELVMSDTDMERRTAAAFIHKARGNVLIFGLGLGFVLPPLMASSRVKHITVVEKEPAVIGLVGGQLLKHGWADHGDLIITTGDAFTWKPSTCSRALPHHTYDTIWFDIWPDICADYAPEMRRLKLRTVRWRNPGCWVGCWGQEEMQRYAKRR